MKRFLIIILVLAIVGVGGYFGFTEWQKAQTANQANYTTVTVERGDLTATVGGTGTTRARQTTNLSWGTSGRISKINVSISDKITTNQVLAVLDDNTISQAIISARADLVTAKRNLENLKNSTLATAQASQALSQAQKALKDALDNRNSYDYNRVSQATIDEAKANLTIAKENEKKAKEIFDKFADKPEDDANRAQALSRYASMTKIREQQEYNLNYLIGLPNTLDISLADAQVEVAKAKLADAQREYNRLKNGADAQDIAAAEARIAALENTINQVYLKAPINGTVTDVKSQVGDQVGVSTISFRIDDLSQMLVDVQITEVDIARVKVGQPVKLTFDAIARKEFNGKVSQVAKVGVPTSGLVNFTVTIEITDTDEAIRPGMTSGVNILVEQVKDVTLIPNRAVRTRNGKQIVYVLQADNSLKTVEIKIGASSDTNSQLVSGDVKQGDILVLNPPVVLSPPTGMGGFSR